MHFRVAGFLTVCAVLWHWCNGQNIPVDLEKDNITPPNMLGQEPPTDKTMGQLIMDAMGGFKETLELKNMHGGILMELDMVLSKEQYYSLYQQPNRTQIRRKRKAIRNPNLRWTNGVIPYRFYPGHFDQRDQDMVRQAMREWERNTCLRFREATSSDVNKVVFTDGRGCFSMLGMVGGEQEVSLSSAGCRYRGLYLHEIGHAIGLVHEHNRPDRDDYVEIIWKNVQTNMLDQFNKYTLYDVDQMNVAYDYSSVMHYAVTDFSKGGGLKTMRVKYPEKEASIGKVYMKELSFTDIEIVNKMYSCHGKCTDKYDAVKCQTWARAGECERNPTWMLANCQKACGKCSVTGKCTDKYDALQCQTWARAGECERNPTWMLPNCQKACGKCSVTS